MYNQTQSYFKSLGYNGETLVTLYRGVSGITGTRGKTYKYKGNAMESWSYTTKTAKNFGSVLAIRVPLKNIIATARSGFGCLNEQEFVLLGNNNIDTLFIGDL